jgi:hypothetical protein
MNIPEANKKSWSSTKYALAEMPGTQGEGQFNMIASSG